MEDPLPETAAKSALKRKKAHEHSLEQTEAQIGTLEQQINAIESANINKETLLAMEKASAAMKQIHGNLTPDKVDETMYVFFFSNPLDCVSAQVVVAHADPLGAAGTSYGSRMHSARRSSTPSRATRSESQSTRTSWKQSWRICNKSSWTNRCSRLGVYPCQIRSSAYPLCQQETVSHAT